MRKLALRRIVCAAVALSIGAALPAVGFADELGGSAGVQSAAVSVDRLESIDQSQWLPAEEVEAEAWSQLEDSYSELSDKAEDSADIRALKDDARIGESYPLQDGSTRWISIDSNTLLPKFTFTIRRPTVVSIDARITPYRSSASFMIENEADQGFILGLAKYGADMHSYPISLPAGTYTVTAFISTDYSGSLGIAYETVPGMDEYADEYVYEYESNGTAEDATPLNEHSSALGFLYNSAMDGTIQEVADLDYYSFTLDEPSYVRVKLVALPGVMFALENAQGDILNFNLDDSENALVGQAPYYGGSVADPTGAFFDCGMLPAGTYYIGVLSDLPRVAGHPYIVGYEIRPSTFMDVDSNTAHLLSINWLAATGVSKGWQQTNGYTFRPYEYVARADMAAFLYRLVGSPEYTPTSADRAKFRDVDSSTPHAKEIWWLASTGITSGWDVGNGVSEFRPYAKVARADMAAFLYRLAGSPDFEPSASERAAFRDVSAKTPHAKEVWWLASVKVSEGWKEPDGSKTFRPYNLVARADMAAFLNRMSDYGLLPIA